MNWRGDVFLRTRAEQHGDVSVVHVQGEVDVLTAPRLETELVGLLSTQRVVLNLADVDLLDLAGVEALQVADREARRAGTKLAVVGSKPIVHTVINTLRLSRAFLICESIAEALVRVKQ